MKITHLFFDLDRTLWDFEGNSHDELMAIYNRNKLLQRGISLPEEFIKIYKKINEECWADYRENRMTKEHLRSIRFQRTLEYYGIEDRQLAADMGIQYVQNSPRRTKLIEGAKEILEYVQSKGYQLHMITNGFEEVQHIKLKECGLEQFFGVVVTSEQAGVKKPNQKIFDMALEKTGGEANQSVYIGDDLIVDCVGANDAGWKAVYFNPHKVSHNHSFMADIQRLEEMTTIF